MSQAGHNIKKLRKVKSLSQQAFAEIFNLSRGNISSYEELRAEPKIDISTKIANYFSIPLEDFLHKSLSVNEILKFNDYFETKETQTISELKSIPFIDRHFLSDIFNYYQSLNDLSKIQFPIYSAKDFLAIELYESIDHHSEFEFKETNIAFFKKLELDLLHTLDGNFGLLFSKDKFFVGKFRTENDTIFLVLNNWHEEKINIEELGDVWKYYGKFEKN